MTQEEDWHFYRDAGHLWRWRQYNGRATIVTKSSIAFSSLAGCIVDAIAHGYSGAGADARDPACSEPLFFCSMPDALAVWHERDVPQDVPARHVQAQPINATDGTMSDEQLQLWIEEQCGKMRPCKSYEAQRERIRYLVELAYQERVQR